MRNIKLIRSNLTAVEQLAERRIKLETEQAELPTAIKTLSLAVSRGDEKSVNALAKAKARLRDALPDELAELDQEYTAALQALFDATEIVQVWVNDDHRDAIKKATDGATNYLSPLIDEPSIVTDLAGQIAGLSTAVRNTYYTTVAFGSMRFAEIRNQTPKDAAKVIALAKDALERLG